MSFKKTNNNLPLLIFGKHPVTAALNNPRRKCKILHTTKAMWEELQTAYPELKINVQLREARDLNMMLPMGSNHQNIILEVAPLKELSIEDILESTSNKQTSCLVILDQVTDPHNVGAIIRSGAAFGIDAVILPENNSPKENNTIIKTSAGACEVVPMVHVTNIAQCIKQLKQEGYWVIGLDGNTNIELSSKILSEKIVFIMGSEDVGMRKLTKDNCDYIAKISISSNAESLNVSNAAAIAMYEFSKLKQIN
ncbi:MAG: 23S rRNA (guanosine(2251)-2'-O)-methyltransferase RlmB [Rickettsiales bacterium]